MSTTALQMARKTASGGGCARLSTPGMMTVSAQATDDSRHGTCNVICELESRPLSSVLWRRHWESWDREHFRSIAGCLATTKSSFPDFHQRVAVCVAVGDPRY